MITAKEARELYEKSGARAKAYLDKEVEPKVKQAIEQGKNFCVIYSNNWPTYTVPQPSDFEKQVMTELKALGYKVQFGGYGDTYVPRGLADDDGNGPEHRNYGIQIGW